MDPHSAVEVKLKSSGGGSDKDGCNQWVLSFAFVDLFAGQWVVVLKGVLLVGAFYAVGQYYCSFSSFLTNCGWFGREILGWPPPSTDKANR